MVNVPRNKGTSAESAVVGYLREHGWPSAERRALRGTLDCGDVTGTPSLAWEVKYAGAGMKIGPWLAETGLERLNSRAQHGILVIKPAGLGLKRVGSWYAVMLAGDLTRLQEDIQANGQGLFMAISAVENYTAGLVRTAMDSIPTTYSRFKDSGAVVFTFRPPGTKDKPHLWYQVMTLEHMTRLLHAAGYGTGDSDGRDRAREPGVEPAHGGLSGGPG